MSKNIQIRIARFQGQLLATAKKTQKELWITLVPKYGFFHFHGDLLYKELFRSLSKDVQVKIVFGITVDSEYWTDKDELVSLEQLSAELEFYHPKIEFRYFLEWTGPHLLISDESRVLAARPDIMFRGGPILNVYNGAADVIQHIELFQRMWDNAGFRLKKIDADIEPNPSNLFALALLKKEWNKISEKISSNPTYLRSISPRDFEELVETIVKKEMTKTTLTPQRRDGGRDIIAIKETPYGNQMLLIECKHYSPNKLVGVEIVRQLYGVIEFERATAGLIITSSSFTSGAKALQRSIAYRMNLSDYKDFVEKIKKAD